MQNVRIHGKTLESWKADYPLLSPLLKTEPVLWLNPHYSNDLKSATFTKQEVDDAEQRLQRFVPYIAKAFPETNGIIESPLFHIPSMQHALESLYREAIPGHLLLKADSHLPISGSIKARGGIYEVLKYAEDLALRHSMLTIDDDYSILDTPRFRKFFSQYSLAVGSTGNLGLSIGIMGTKLGFQVTVHMSHDAKQWKKNLLRTIGVNVKEYNADYSKAVEEGRKLALQDPSSYFIDDENSKHLFLGYAVAAKRLQKQLEERSITISAEQPLIVYLPCGVGGGPGGVTFGLKLLFGEHVHSFFAEPTHSPCMLLGMMTELYDDVSVQDFGIDNQTEADGLAVGRSSSLVGRTMKPLLSGIYTIEDKTLFSYLRLLADTEQLYLEPSALAGMHGPLQLIETEQGREYIQKHHLQHAVHIVWATGGSMVPHDIMQAYYIKK
jgi:D-serine dehydratase